MSYLDDVTTMEQMRTLLAENENRRKADFVEFQRLRDILAKQFDEHQKFINRYTYAPAWIVEAFYAHMRTCPALQDAFTNCKIGPSNPEGRNDPT